LVAILKKLVCYEMKMEYQSDNDRALGLWRLVMAERPASFSLV